VEVLTQREGSCVSADDFLGNASTALNKEKKRCKVGPPTRISAVHILFWKYSFLILTKAKDILSTSLER
jgi:hypothetical protein